MISPLGLTFGAIFAIIALMETLLTRPAIETAPGSLDMAGFEQAFAAPTAVPTPEAISAPEQAAAPEFNMELVGMFMRAHGNTELSNILAGVIAADILTKNMLYQQEQAAIAETLRRADDYRAFDLIVEKNKSEDDEK